MSALPFEGLNVIRNNLFWGWRLKIHNFPMQCLCGWRSRERDGTCGSLAARCTKKHTPHLASPLLLIELLGAKSFVFIPRRPDKDV